MLNYENPQNAKNQNNDSIISHNKEILNMIDDHKKKLQEIRDINNHSSSNNFFINKNKTFDKNLNENKNIRDIERTTVDESIRIAKDFLKYNQEKTSKLFNSIDNKINMNNTYNYYYPRKNLSNNYRNDNYQEVYKSNNGNNGIQKNNEIYLKEKQDENYINKNNYGLPLNNNTTGIVIPKRSITAYDDNLNNIKNNRKTNHGYHGYNGYNGYSFYNDRTYNIDDESNIINDSNIKLLKHKLENNETKIKSLESNIDILTKENQSLKHYINELETKYNNFVNNQTNNKNDNNIINSNSASNEENIKIINDNIEKVMYSINYFIKKMYNLLPNMGKEINYEELKIEQYNELQQHLNIIENNISELFIQSIKKINYSLNDNTMTVTDLSSINHIKKEKKQPKLNTIIKKLKSKSVKKLKKKKNVIGSGYINKSLNKTNISRTKKNNK